MTNVKNCGNCEEREAQLLRHAEISSKLVRALAKLIIAIKRAHSIHASKAVTEAYFEGQERIREIYGRTKNDND